MNGAESLVRTLVKGGVEVCFANPGTSEMHFVGALDRVEGMRCVLGLFEGVCSGAADGYYRMKDKPASTLLHLGPGPRQRGGQPAQRQEGGLRHRQHRRRARALSHQVRHAAHRRHRGHRPAVLALGEDLADVQDRGQGRRRGDPGGARRAGPDRHPDPAGRHGVDRGRRRGRHARDAAAAEARQRDGRRRGQGAEGSGDSAMLFIGGRALRARGLELAGKIAAKTGCKVQARRRHGAHRARRRPRAGAAPALRGRDGAGDAEGHQADGAGAAPRRRPRSSPIPASRRCWCRTAARSTTLCPVDGDPIGSLEALATELGALNEKPAGVAQAEAAGAADRQVHARRPRPGAGRDDAGRRDRGRRIGDHRPRLLPVQRSARRRTTG